MTLYQSKMSRFALVNFSSLKKMDFQPTRLLALFKTTLIVIHIVDSKSLANDLGFVLMKIPFCTLGIKKDGKYRKKYDGGGFKLNIKTRDIPSIFSSRC